MKNWIVALLLALTGLPGAALAGTYVISNEPGGSIGRHDTRFAAIAARGDNVRISGKCLSACTLVIRNFPRNRICMTDGGYFGFHTGSDGRGGASFAGTEYMLNSYPADIRAWINAKGGLSKSFIYMRAPETYRYFRRC